MAARTTVTIRWDRAGIDRLLHDPTGPTGQLLLRIATRIQNRGRELAPVDTGLMRSRIDVVPPEQGPDGLHAAVVARTNYALYVHEGTYRTHSRPFLTDAARDVMAGL